LMTWIERAFCARACSSAISRMLSAIEISCMPHLFYVAVIVAIPVIGSHHRLGVAASARLQQAIPRSLNNLATRTEASEAICTI
jgi:hypothetical protein